MMIPSHTGVRTGGVMRRFLKRQEMDPLLTFPIKPRIGGSEMKQFFRVALTVLVNGFLVVVPIYLTVLLLMQPVHVLVRLVKPVAKVFPVWVPAENILSLLLILMICFLTGLALRTSIGRATSDAIEDHIFRRFPGYQLFRSLTKQIAGERQESTWKPALAEIEHALVPAFIIEELEGGRFTVFVPSTPTPVTGAIYILTPDRVHPLDVSLAQAIKAVARWGVGCKDLVAAMKIEVKG
jgi:uncharacterized membrane protein